MRALFLPMAILVLGCAQHRVRTLGEDVVLWEETDSGRVAQYLKMRHVAFKSDGRGLIVAWNEESHRALIDLCGILRQRKEILRINVWYADVTNDGQTKEERDSQGNRYVRYIPYRRRDIVIEEGEGGAPVARVIDDDSDFPTKYDPSHPHSGKNPEAPDFGRVCYPNVNLEAEKFRLIEVTRSYETVLEVLKSWE